MSARFRLERDLCAVLQSRSRSILPTRRREIVVQLEEQQVGAVIPDLILIRSPSRISTTPLSALESAIVATLLRGRSLRVATIARRLFTREQRVSPALAVLCRRGLLRQAPNGSFSVAAAEAWNRVHVVAVEAKLCRWREAISQAGTYRVFANQAFVALPATTISRNVQVLDAAQQEGIGVLSVKRGAVSIIREAADSAAASPDWFWVVSRGLARGRRRR